MDNSQSPEKIIYWLDQSRKIIDVSGPWDEFAVENNGRDALAGRVRGRLLWEFIKGDATRMWMDTLINLAVVTGRQVERLYRCDSPDLKRNMKMTIIPGYDTLIKIEHQLLSTERKHVSSRFHYSGDDLPGIRKRCSICGRINSPEGWSEPDREALDKGLEGDISFRVIYTVCDDCSSDLVSRRGRVNITAG